MMSLLSVQARSQAAEYAFWDGPYKWFVEADRYEIEHAALIGKPGPSQGKVVLIRDHVDRGIWLWDSSSPTSVEGSAAEVFNNMSCGGHAWDDQGDLIFAGGDKNGDYDNMCMTEPVWSYVFRPDIGAQGEWEVTQDMLVPAGSSTVPPARFGYYYPTAIALHDGQVVSLGGGSAPWRQIANTPCSPAQPPYEPADLWQVYNKAAGRWEGTLQGASGDRPLPGLPDNTLVGAGPMPLGFRQYPSALLLSTGDLFCPNVWDSGRELGTATDPAAPGRRYSCSAHTSVATWTPTAWTPLPWLPQSFANRKKDTAGNTVNLLYPTIALFPYHIISVNGQPTLDPASADRILVIGGYDHQPETWTNTINGQPAPNPNQRDAQNSVWEITNPTGNSAWSNPPNYGTMIHRRVYANAVTTPDLKLIVLGGSAIDFHPYNPNFQVEPQPVLEPEMLDLLNPQAGWQPLQSHQSPRLYHSIALDLADGRILHGSGYKATIPAGSLSHTDAEVFTPPCLQQALSRPTILGAPATIGYGTPIAAIRVSVPNAQGQHADEIDFVTLIRCGSLTHHADVNQRCIRLDIVARSNDLVTPVSLPSQAQGGHFIAPPGYYFLFVLTTLRGNPLVRVPSVAKYVHIG